MYNFKNTNHFAEFQMGHEKKKKKHQSKAPDQHGGGTSKTTK